MGELLPFRRAGIPAWNYGYLRKGGGAFRDMGVHVLNFAWVLMGMPKPIGVLGVSGAKFGPRALGLWNPSMKINDVKKNFETDDYTAGFIRFENGAALRVFHELQKHPVTTIAKIAKQCKLTIPTVTLSLKHLSSLNIFEEISGKERNRIYRYSQYLDVLHQGIDEF
tara:strand:- start:156 stop:656 length:501 start_codon:yes stop_codon:yes gene_type:complete